MPRLRILFVLSQLVQHGSERYLFEVCRALDRTRFDVQVMTRKFWVRHHYYYRPLSELGIPIHRKLFSRRYVSYPVRRLYQRYSWLCRLLDGLHARYVRFDLGDWFSRFDVVAAVGIETYCDALKPLLAGSDRVVIHHISHSYQFERDYYAECDQRRFVLLDEHQAREMAASPLAGADTFLFPLTMRLDATAPRYTAPQVGQLRLACVSRLSPDRPNEPMFDLLARLRRRTDAVLYVYGGGDRRRYRSLLQSLGVEHHVHFCGHESDLAAALARDRITLVLAACNGTTIGYGSVEVAALGFPMVFLNRSQVPDAEIAWQSEGALHTFVDSSDAAAFIAALASEPHRLEHLGEKLRHFALARYDIAPRIAALERYYLDVAMRQGAAR